MLHLRRHPDGVSRSLAEVIMEGNAVINDLGKAICLLIAILTTQACANAVSVNLKEESERLTREICSQKTLADAQRALDSQRLEYYLNEPQMQLNAIKRYDEDQIVSSAIAITVVFGGDRRVISCKVEILHTGP